MRIALLALFTALAFAGQAQQYLYLKKGNEFPAKRFGLKERVTFKTAGEDRWSKGMIDKISSERITIDGVMYPLSEIAAFRSSSELLDIAGSAMIGGGTLFTGIILVNGLINGDQPIIKQSQIIVGAALVAGGFLVRLLSRKTYRKEDGWKWVTIDLNKFNGE